MRQHRLLSMPGEAEMHEKQIWTTAFLMGYGSLLVLNLNCC